MFPKILLGVVILVAAVLIFAATKPARFHIEKSIFIEAPPEKVFAMIGDFRNWPRWAPQDREDATMHRSYSGSANGAGAVSDWTSKGSAGAGRMTITVAAAPSTVQVTVDWSRPFKVQNAHGFAMLPVAGGTQLTWTADGTNLYMMKVMEVFVGVDGLMGKHLEDGLRNLKAVAEH
ncbi:MAG TPA: SRPBCC family protein [Terracidiphilus sp.]|jgi:uncharacterized protein YndB with AHSA1/START domain|nr:SRPBCC family protein [Terracidiphilus sp.]